MSSADSNVAGELFKYLMPLNSALSAI